MDPMVESAFIAAVATLVGVGGAVVVAIVSARISHSTNQETINAAAAATDKTIQAVRETNLATIDTTRAGQIADLYSRAIDQLGSEKLDTRIGGIYALERVARESERDHPTVMDVLTAFIREYSYERWPPEERQEPERWTRPDIQAAITVVGRRNVENDPPGQRIDLYGATLINANLNSANLRDAALRGANLTGAYLYDAILVDADLRDVTLDDAHLHRKDLTRPADLTGAEWSKDKPVPEGWTRNTVSSRLGRLAADTSDSGLQR